MNYKKLNVYLGWLVFLIATIVYFITIEDTVSLWDCGEYITAAYKLEVGHPPGAPLFMLLGRLFSFFADPEGVAVWINRMSALSSSATILFMFWSITMLAKKMVYQKSRTFSKGDMIAVLGSGFIGAMAYAFTDSFWFSAVEGEVYAMSSLFTAMIFWAILKWDEEMEAIKHGELDGSHSPMRWMILIMFLFGLAIGVHLLGLLAIPAIAYVIYFNQWKTVNLKGFFLTGIISIFALGFIQEGIIPGTISLASKFEIAFVNSMGMPFYLGGMFFFLLLILGCVFLVRWSRKNNKPLINAIGLGFIVFLIGYGSFATIVIRSSANTPLDENDPENLVTLHAYLKREQYGSWPILYGPYWNSAMDDSEKFGDKSRFYARRYVVTRAESDLKAFKSEAIANKYAKNLGRNYEVVEKYYVTNEEFRKHQEPVYIQNTFFPRMFWNQESDAAKINGYKDWSGYSANNDVDLATAEIGVDGKRLPTFGENLTYFARYQVNWMYWRYFMWNFAGRQNDIQGHGDQMRGNWLSGISAIDEIRLGSQAANASNYVGDQVGSVPTFTANNQGHNTFFFLPLILGFIGMFFHFYRAPKDAFIVLLTFIFTGMAIVVYLNQKPFEPRERDYAYAASFYAFAMWIGLGVFALYQAFKSFGKKEFVGFGIIAGAGIPVCLIFDVAAGEGYPVVMSWLFMAFIAIIALGIMAALGKKSRNETNGASLAVILTLGIPLLMAFQGWDDHDRSDKTSARDLAYNYLQSCAKNGILFTNGDNDTFPLWYLQEVEGKRTDVRVCNLSLMGTDWYTDQMKMKAYDSDALPIKFTEDQIMMYAGSTDQVYFLSMFEMMRFGVPKTSIENIYNTKIKYNKDQFKQSFETLRRGMLAVANTLKAKDPATEGKLNNIKTNLGLVIENPTAADIEVTINYALDIFASYSGGTIEGEQEPLQQLQTSLVDWEKPWDFMPITEAMEFTRNDDNMFATRGSKMRIFPSKGFILPINKANALKSGIIEANEVSSVAKEIRFSIDKQYLTREQVMMMDILANNDWKRAIYFSSPYGSSVSIALFQAGFVKQNGIVYELSPVKAKDNNPVNVEKMYKNIMEVYDYGKMNQKGVLTDYYSRRHTSQFRTNFAKLAETYVRDAEFEMARKENYTSQIARFKAAGNNRLADSLKNVIAGADERAAKYNKRAIALIQKSLKVMPVELVIDYGEPNPDGREMKGTDGASYQSFADGSLHDYVSILYRAGDKVGGEKLGTQIAREIETIFNYFENSSAVIVSRNKSDLVAALSNYMTMSMIVSDPELGNPNGALAIRMNKKIRQLYQNVFENKYRDLKDLSVQSGEGSRTGYGSMLTELKGHLDAVGMQFGYIQRPIETAPNPSAGGASGLTPEQIKQLMEAQGQGQE